MSKNPPLPESAGLDGLHEVARWLASEAPSEAAGAAIRALPCSRKDLIGAARSYVAARRARERMFPAGLFADPAWDILLDLFVAEAEGDRPTVTSACDCAGIPPTTALRWLSRLEELGLVERRRDEQDGRRAYVTLAPPARSTIERWLRSTFF